jgi:5-(carboxyamino)imidazole ribonucleotide mutase
VGTLAIGKPGAINAALMAVSILGVKSAKYRKIYDQFRKAQSKKALAKRHLKLPAEG